MARRLSEKRYAWITRAALTSLVIIVITGAAVRLTGSGLGCSDWPRCNEEKFVDVSSFHGAIEQLNRLFTGVVTVLVMASVLAARFLVERRRDLERLAWLLVVGVVGQIVLGGVVVLTDLNPVANQGHFLLSMFLVATGLILVKKAGGREASIATTLRIRRLVRLVAALAGMAIVTGTVVTGAGPHAGDEKAPRLDVAITTAARIHGIAVFTTLVAIVVLLVAIRRSSFGTLHSAIEVLLVLGVLQATVGYVQYFNDIPAALVGIHIALATAFFLAIVNLWWVAGRTRNQIEDERVAIVSR
ncbi:MAG: COX15/CtaA family protein [Ilumatobacteraceae bacterium]